MVIYVNGHLYVCVCVYIYVRVYVHMYTHTNIYQYTHAGLPALSAGRAQKQGQPSIRALGTQSLGSGQRKQGALEKWSILGRAGNTQGEPGKSRGARE